MVSFFNPGIPDKRDLQEETFPEFDEPDLWGERQEYLYYGYPELILDILQVHNPCSYNKIKEILEDNNMPTDLGYIVRGISELEKAGKITRKRNSTGSIITLSKENCI